MAIQSTYSPPESTPFAQLGAIFHGYGLELSALEPPILARMSLLSEVTETVKDGARLVELAEDVFRYYEAQKPERSMTPLERKTVAIGSLFADIGKSGPAHADASGQRLICEMFAVEGVPDETMRVSDFLARYFPADATERSARFRDLGLDPSLSMRQFWNLHSLWTLNIIQGGGVPPEAVAAAATHHLLENVNPAAIVAQDGHFTRYFGDNERVDRPEKLVILLDKYDAARRRAGHSHAEAIAGLRALVAKNPRFAHDAELSELIDDLETALHVADERGEYHPEA